jgi:hypothetical protein
MHMHQTSEGTRVHRPHSCGPTLRKMEAPSAPVARNRPICSWCPTSTIVVNPGKETGKSLLEGLAVGSVVMVMICG